MGFGFGWLAEAVFVDVGQPPVGSREHRVLTDGHAESLHGDIDVSTAMQRHSVVVVRVRVGEFQFERSAGGVGGIAVAVLEEIGAGEAEVRRRVFGVDLQDAAEMRFRGMGVLPV